MSEREAEEPEEELRQQNQSRFDVRLNRPLLALEMEVRLQAKECRQPPGAGKGKETKSLLEPSEGIQPATFWISTPETCGESLTFDL